MSDDESNREEVLINKPRGTRKRVAPEEKERRKAERQRAKELKAKKDQDARPQTIAVPAAPVEIRRSVPAPVAAAIQEAVVQEESHATEARKSQQRAKREESKLAKQAKRRAQEAEEAANAARERADREKANPFHPDNMRMLLALIEKGYVSVVPVGNLPQVVPYTQPAAVSSGKRGRDDDDD